MVHSFSDRLTPRAPAAAILLAGFAAALIVNWPGHLEFDSILQLLEGRTGRYSNWHPPVMSWLLGLSDAMSGDARWFVLLDTAMAFGALGTLLWIAERPGWSAVVAAAVAAALPQLFFFQAIVFKDILFADACVAGFVCVAAAARWPRRRSAWLAGAVLFVTLAALARQNGFLIVPIAALTAAFIAPDRRRTGMEFLAACIVLMLGANALLQTRATGALGATEQLEDLELYDLAGMMRKDPGLAVPILDRDAPGMAKILHQKGAAFYTPAAHDALADKSGMKPFIVSSIDAVARQWRASVWAHPLLYLSVRAADFSYVFLSLHPDVCPVYVVGVDGPAAAMKALNLRYRDDGRDDWLDDSYAGPLVGTPVFSHPFFAAVAIACFVLLLHRRRPADLAMAGLLSATALYAASYFVISLACEYRYLFAIDLSAIAAAFYLAADFRARERSS
ncbi:MAG: glycosyltransferase family 39 protein [Rhizomicrobium sp.]